jgi:hypothetical protein
VEAAEVRVDQPRRGVPVVVVVAVVPARRRFSLRVHWGRPKTSRLHPEERRGLVLLQEAARQVVRVRLEASEERRRSLRV